MNGTSLHRMLSAFDAARKRYTSGAAPYSPLEAEALRIVEGLENAATEAVYAENNEGGKARSAVSAIARVLGVSLHAGAGDVWGNDNMRRVIDAAKALKDDRDHWEAEAGNWQAARDTWKALAEQHDAELAPARSAARCAIRERDSAVERSVCLTVENDDLRRRLDVVSLGVARGFDTEDDLRATVVRQALEITELKGESE